MEIKVGVAFDGGSSSLWVRFTRLSSRHSDLEKEDCLWCSYSLFGEAVNPGLKYRVSATASRNLHGIHLPKVV